MSFRQLAYNRKRLVKYQYGGDPNRDAIYGATSGIVETGLNMALPGLGSAYGSVTGLSDSLTTNPDGTYKSTGAAIGNYITNPLAFVADASTGNIGRKKQRLAAEEEIIKSRMRGVEVGKENLRGAIAGGYNQTGYEGTLYRKYGGKVRYAYGANVDNPQYEVEKGEVVEGEDVNLESGKKLASDMTKVTGKSHEEGGVEGEGGERVFSDKIKLTSEALDVLKSMGFKPKGKPTVAEASEFVAKKQKVYEELLQSSKPMDTETGKRMLDRIEQAKELIFQDQEMQKEIDMERSALYRRGGSLQKMADGGYPTPTKNQSDSIYKRNKKKNNYNIERGVKVGSGDEAKEDGSLNTESSQEEETNKLAKYAPFVGAAINTLNYAANASAINKLKTQIEPVMPTANYRQYVDRSGLAVNRIQSNLNTGVRGLRYSSSRSKNAAIGSMVGQSYDAINQATNAENLRKDSILAGNVDIQNNNALYRSQVSNQFNVDNVNRSNEVIATKVQARNAYLDAAMKQVTENRDTKYANDKNDADTEAKQAEMKLMIMSNQNGVADALAKEYGIEGASREEVADRWIKEHFTFKKRKGGYLR